MTQMNIFALIFLLLKHHPKGVHLLITAFRVFREADTAGFDREKVCAEMIKVIPEDGGVSASQVYAMRELYDNLSTEMQDHLMAVGNMGITF